MYLDCGVMAILDIGLPLCIEQDHTSLELEFLFSGSSITLTFEKHYKVMRTVENV
ncbi:12581_t:CDS:2 [Funneliformis caledonium]|uniref:12581_t:CDS:1 n=1 Tax=Funneliformis caledonium TaxID=1117310 RepID=A0A9N8W4K4_9GLOM|nr:12581_t:CDS:2 [Funneliformis caledonium]